MKFHLKSFVSGILVTCFVLGVTATALAAGGSVSFNSVNLRFNGQQISAKGEDFTIDGGVSVPASILYTDENGGGTTYLPIARISDLLGTKIGWDGSTGSVLIGEEPNAPDPVTTADYSNWTAEQEAAYQEFKAMWDIEYRGGGDVKYKIDGTFTNTPWEGYRLSSNNLLTYAEFSNTTSSALRQGFIERLAYETRTSNDIILVEMDFRFDSISFSRQFEF